MAKAATPRKSIFIPGAFDDLRAAAGEEADNASLRIRLVDIDEDPNQPRTVFDEAELRQLADTIELLGGVLQPIGVRTSVGGRYTLVFGARRFRASKLLGLADIKAIVVPDDQASLAAQVIENQSRANLSNSDLAAVVGRLSDQGVKSKQIAVICGLTDYAVTMFRSAPRLPAFLSARVNGSDMRAIYELFTTWQKQPAQIEEALAEHDAALSVTEARRIIEAATGKATSSIYLRGKPNGETMPAAEAPRPPHSAEAAPPAPGAMPTATERSRRPHSAETSPASQVILRNGSGAPEPALSPSAASKPPHSAEAAHVSSIGTARGPVFIVELPDGRRGFLVTTEHTGNTGDEGTVLVDVHGEKVEAPFVGLRPVSVG